MDAVLLTGGRSARLGGVHKPSLDVGGTPMVERALQAVKDADRVVVVGPDPGLPGTGIAVVTCEDPPGGGPVAAVAAALPHVTAPEVAVLATDLPFVTPAAVERLRADLTDGTAAAVAVDGDGRDQPLLSVWSTAALRAAMASLGPPAGLPMKALTAAAPGPVLRVADLGPPGGPAPPWFDCDTPADLARARAVLAGKELPMTPLDEWMDAVIAELGLAGAVERDSARTLMLDLARDVAHGVARPAAPVTAFLAGLAAGRSPDPVGATSEVTARIAALVRAWPGAGEDPEGRG